MKVYLCGPMTGLPNYNMDEFDRFKIVWEERGHHVFSPAGISRTVGEGKVWDNVQLMQMCMACVFAADSIVLLPGWENSKGSAAEIALSQFLGKGFYDAVSGDPIHPADRPWSRIKS